MSQPFDEHNTEITSIQPMCDESPWHPGTVDKLLLSGILLQGLLTVSHLHYNTPTQWSPLKLHCKVIFKQGQNKAFLLCSPLILEEL